MTDFARLQTHQTLKAAGFPTDLNAIIGRTLTYLRYNGATGRHTVIGIDFGIETLRLHLDTRIGIFDHRALLLFDPRVRFPWEGWFLGKEEPESLVRVQLL